jgi:16S rRNA (uracil1498-N3)-methyltransferase
VPVVAPLRPLSEWLQAASAVAPPPGALRLVLSTRAEAPPLGRWPVGAAPLWALSGPEGGLAPAEEAAAVAAGFQPVSLGPRILRADTAPLALLAWLGLRA